MSEPAEFGRRSVLFRLLGTAFGAAEVTAITIVTKPADMVMTGALLAQVGIPRSLPNHILRGIPEVYLFEIFELYNCNILLIIKLVNISFGRLMLAEITSPLDNVAVKSLRALLHGLIDYAGLFPPANLEMPAAVWNYATYHEAPTAWALGRFILPAARLDEFEAALQESLPRSPVAPWWLSVLGSATLAADLARIARFNDHYRGGADTGALVIDAIELKASTPEAITEAMKALPSGLEPYFEIPVRDDPRDLIATLANAGARAKVRTGGLTQDMFPAAADLARFIHACIEARVPFKATAGLHHPIRALYPLTYEPGSPTGMMYGFLNVFLAAAFLQASLPLAEATEMLEEQSPQAFHFDEKGVAWRTHRLDHAVLLRARQQCALAFGSCSFREPIDGLAELKLL